MPTTTVACRPVYTGGLAWRFVDVMNNDYEAFCMADPVFYDSPGNGPASEPYALAGRDAPAQWQRDARGHWTIFTPMGHRLPTQGWKIHVAGTLANAEHVIEAVWDYSVPRDIAFKFLTSPRVVLARNAKYAGRGGSGKLVTVYPHDEGELKTACQDLDALLAGEPGPTILSDLRWAAGPVHVRYGGFAPRYCQDERGEQVLAIEDPAGELVPDVRGPVFSLPPWVRPPAFLRPHLEARAATTVADIPYRIEEALHFSNGGGVYRGVDESSGEAVVLKEARPHAGLSGDGTDAVTRLRRERDALDRLAGVDAVPKLIDYLTIGDHEFLVMELIEGEPLNGALATRCPLLDAAVDDASRAAYAAWARSIHDDIAAAIAAIHQRGVVYGDLHLFNVIVRSDGRIALIDFEVADDADADRRPTLGAVGFVAPPDRRGVDIDLYALACLQLALFLPLERLMSLDHTKAAHLADIIADTFPVSRSWLDEAVAVINGQPEQLAGRRATWREGRRHQQVHGHWRVEPTTAGWCRVRRSISDGILASATPPRDDRLFPGDIVQFDTGGGLALAHGAAGVLYALAVTGAGTSPDHEEWLIRRSRDAAADLRLGFYDGLHGIVHVLDHLGHRAEALKLLDRSLDLTWDGLGDDLHRGLAGVGLNLAHMADATGDPALDQAAQQATQQVADRLGGVEDVAETSGGAHPFAGLMRGSAGRALLFMRMYERTGEPNLLDHAATALRQDLRRCVRRDKDGQLHVNEGHRTLPYLALGSAGIGLVLGRYLTHRADDELAAAAHDIHGAACSLFYVQAGLFNGRAGMVLYLSRTRRRPDAPTDPDLADQVSRLGWHALRYQGHLAFPGDQLLRLSMDLATGGAGVLLALGSALHDRPVHLPFLAPTPVPVPRVSVSIPYETEGR
ncbi:MAG TPA: class III lanthionine synthetase LanKC [Acidimicrobiales bacterium]